MINLSWTKFYVMDDELGSRKYRTLRSWPRVTISVNRSAYIRCKSIATKNSFDYNLVKQKICTFGGFSVEMIMARWRLQGLDITVAKTLVKFKRQTTLNPHLAVLLSLGKKRPSFKGVGNYGIYIIWPFILCSNCNILHDIDKMCS